MSDIAVKVENLSKRYRIGLREKVNDRATDAIAAWIRSPFANLRRLRNLSRFRAEEDETDIIWALNNVSFEVKAGEAFGIIGRNGAGKSTLLKILSRITEPTSGRVILNGRVSSLLEVGTGFHQELTGRENVYLNGTILGMAKAEIDRKFDEIVDFSGIEKFLDTPVKRYSSGMRVRLAFSVAAHLEPEILMVDEVLAVGDAEFQKKCLTKMGGVSKEGRTVLLVSHNMAAVQTLCQKALCLENGRVMAHGGVNQVVTRYLDVAPADSSSNGHDDDLAGLVRSQGLKCVFVKGFLNGTALRGHHTLLPRSTCEFRLIIQMYESMRQCTIGIHFENEIGIRVFAVNTRFVLKKVDLDEGTYEVRCTIPKIPIVPGNYYLALGFSSDNKQIDWLERISCLEISSTDVYGTGELPRGGQGYFLPEANWNIQQVEKVMSVRVKAV